MKTLKFYIGNDVAKKVNVNLPPKALKILIRHFGIQDRKMIYGFLQKHIASDFANLYASFEEGKCDYENFILDILEEKIDKRGARSFSHGQHDDWFEDVNELFDADCITRYDLPGMEMAERSV